MSTEHIKTELDIIITYLKQIYEHNRSMYQMIFDIFDFKNNIKEKITSDILTDKSVAILIEAIKLIKQSHPKSFDANKTNNKFNKTTLNYEDENVQINVIYSLSRNITKTSYEENIKVLNGDDINELFNDLKLKQTQKTEHIGGAGVLALQSENIFKENPITNDDELEKILNMKKSKDHEHYQKINTQFNEIHEYEYEITTIKTIFTNEFLRFDDEKLIALTINPVIVRNKEKIIELVNNAKDKNLSELIEFLKSIDPNANKYLNDAFNISKKYKIEKNNYDAQINKNALLVENYKSSDFYIITVDIYDKKINYHIEREFEFGSEKKCLEYCDIIYGLYKLL